MVLLVLFTLLAALVPGLLPREEISSGTGFAIAAGGYILTAAHVVRGAAEITVFVEGRPRRATSVATSLDHDLALLYLVDGPDLPVVIVTSGVPEPGDGVTAIGFPSGTVQPVVQSTQVAAVGWWAVGPEGAVMRDLVVAQDPFRRGYSGGPLVDEAGRVVGVVVGTVTTTGGRELGFAISSRSLAAWLSGRGMTVHGPEISPDPQLTEAERAARIRPSLVRVEARFPPGARR